MLFRYFLAHLTRTIAMVLTIVIGLFFTITLLEKLGDAPGVVLALQASMLEIPNIIHIALPASSALGCAVALAMLDGRREMVLLRLIGISPARIVCWLLLASTLWMASYLAFTELVLPLAGKLSRNIEIQRSGSLITADEVIWIRTSDGFASVGHLTPDGTRVSNLWLFTQEGDSFSQVRWAQQAAFTADGWKLYEVDIAVLQDDSWRLSQARTATWPQGPAPNLFVSFSIPPESLPMQGLLELSDALQDLGQNSNTVDLIIWSRLFDAMAIAVLMLASLLLVRYRAGPTAKSVRAATALAVLAVLLYHYFQLIVRQYGVDQNWPGLAGAAIPPVFVALALAGFVLWDLQVLNWRQSFGAQGGGPGIRE